MSRQKKENVQSAFWDTSAIVPLCCLQSVSSRCRQAARTYGRQIVWWATSVESSSAIQRLVRNGDLLPKDSAKCLACIAYLRDRWNEVQPSNELKDRAERLLRMHPLRAADALQLAAALDWCGSYPRGRAFVVSDGVLAQAAELEGFNVVLV